MILNMSLKLLLFGFTVLFSTVEGRTEPLYPKVERGELAEQEETAEEGGRDNISPYGSKVKARKMVACLQQRVSQTFLQWDTVLAKLAQSRIEDILEVAEYQPKKWKGVFAGYKAMKMKYMPYKKLKPEEACDDYMAMNGGELDEMAFDYERIGCGVTVKTRFAYIACLAGGEIQVPRVEWS